MSLNPRASTYWDSILRHHRANLCLDYPDGDDMAGLFRPTKFIYDLIFDNLSDSKHTLTRDIMQLILIIATAGSSV